MRYDAVSAAGSPFPFPVAENRGAFDLPSPWKNFMLSTFLHISIKIFMIFSCVRLKMFMSYSLFLQIFHVFSSFLQKICIKKGKLFLSILEFFMSKFGLSVIFIISVFLPQ